MKLVKANFRVFAFLFSVCFLQPPENQHVSLLGVPTPRFGITVLQHRNQMELVWAQWKRQYLEDRIGLWITLYNFLNDRWEHVCNELWTLSLKMLRDSSGDAHFLLHLEKSILCPSDLILINQLQNMLYSYEPFLQGLETVWYTVHSICACYSSSSKCIFVGHLIK